jgi:hypothetical protein
VKIVRWFAGSPLSRIYLLVVAAVTAWSLWETLTWSRPDATFAGVWPMFLTMPLSLPLVTVLPDDWTDPLPFVACITVAALVNAAALNGLITIGRRRRPGAD